MRQASDELIIRQTIGPDFRLVSAELTETRTYTDSVHRFYDVVAVSSAYRNELTVCIADTPGSPKLACRLGSDYHLITRLSSRGGDI